MIDRLPPILRFRETFFERIWGGDRLRRHYGKSVPAGGPFGESWLIADHPQCESVVEGGPLAGATLRDIMREAPSALLGDVRPTPDLRFPLLLKLIDAAEVLSVQVHPDDVAAVRLGEPDVGKTEMWYVVRAEAGAELICGLLPGTTRADFEAAIAAGTTDQLLKRFPAPEGTSVFVPAGTVHAICGGLLLAEIQQNSDITYRIFDWNRTDAQGKSRELHIDKSLEVMDFSGSHPGPATPRPTDTGIEELASCAYFTAERFQADASFGGSTHGKAFHILLAYECPLTIGASGETMELAPGEAALIPASAGPYSVVGPGRGLRYSVAPGETVHH